MQYWKQNPINCFGTIESIGKNETHPVAKRNFKFASKGIAILIVVMIIFYIVNIVYKIFLINYLEERFKEYDNWNNYYVEIRSFEEAKHTETRQIWYRDNKYKIIVESIHENQGNSVITKWIDCDNSTIIVKENDKILYKRIYKDQVKKEYENGKYLNNFMSWKDVIINNKVSTIAGIKPIYLCNDTGETKLNINNMTIKFKKEQIIPTLFIDKRNNTIYYKYYNIKLNCIKDDEVSYAF